MTQMASWVILGLVLFANVATLQSSAAAPTTTVTRTVTGTEGACNNFYGACVVYTYGGTAAYTTTVYGSLPATTTTPTSVTTRVTTTTEKTTTVSGAGACNNYEGACVVYGTVESPTTTVYAGSSNGHGGSADGIIGETSNEDDPVGSDAARLDMGSTAAFAAGVTLVSLSLTVLL